MGEDADAGGTWRFWVVVAHGAGGTWRFRAGSCEMEVVGEAAGAG